MLSEGYCVIRVIIWTTLTIIGVIIIVPISYNNTQEQEPSYDNYNYWKSQVLSLVTSITVEFLQFIIGVIIVRIILLLNTTLPCPGGFGILPFVNISYSLLLTRGRGCLLLYHLSYYYH
uniref:Uncharacterized protein n=1 Tax=Sphaerobolus stellatus TaxID=68786 RepID=A0A7D4VED6_9AGAM|nr:hypothetical protein [Sphaerobolus stellatus]